MPDPSPVPRVGFNATLLSLSATYRSAGIHRYILGLLTALAEDGKADLVAFLADRRAQAALPATIICRIAPAWAGHRLGRIGWEQAVLPFALHRGGARILHSPAYAMPRFCPVPAVVTVHDLAPFRVAETFPARQAAYLRAATRSSVRRAAEIIAVSEFTRRELIDLLGAAPERVHVVANGVDGSFQPLPAEVLAAYRQRTGLPDRFILTVGTLQPRKNLGTLLAAYAELWRQLGSAPDLVVAGAPGWGGEDLRRHAAALGLEAHVHLTGFVAAADLPALYGAAAVFALPSRYEGFGLPVIEAMACGTPVVAARAGSLPEVGGEAALYVAPDDVGGWAKTLASICAQPDLAARMSTMGRTQAARFAWDHCARETAAVYRLAAGMPAPAPARIEAGHGPA